MNSLITSVIASVIVSVAAVAVYVEGPFSGNSHVEIKLVNDVWAGSLTAKVTNTSDEKVVLERIVCVPSTTEALKRGARQEFTSGKELAPGAKLSVVVGKGTASVPMNCEAITRKLGEAQ